MSAETLKFFEDKSTESIINWMMTHLSEEQIRMCLDQSGIPDTSLAPPAVGSSSGIQQAPVLSATVTPEKPIQVEKPKTSASDLFTTKYRKKCVGTQYLIKKVSKDGVEYFEFKEVESEDLSNNPGFEIGTANWVFKIQPVSTFKDYCTADDREVLELLKEEYASAYNNPPPGVIEVAQDYVSSGLESPIPLGIQGQIPVAPPQVIAPTVSAGMIKAIKIQQDASPNVTVDYPILASRGITTYPIFVYDFDGPKVKHLNVVVSDGRLTLVEDMTNERILNSKFKKVLQTLNDAITSGTYNPPDNIQLEINEAMRRVNPEIPLRVKQVYNPEQIAGYTFFGTTLDDDSWSDISDAEQIEIKDWELDDILDQMEKTKLEEKRNKKPTEMSQEELEEYTIEKYGRDYFDKFKPEIYRNAVGYKNIRYVKRAFPLSEDTFEEIKNPKFTEFQGRPSINSGPGRFGDDELLF